MKSIVKNIGLNQIRTKLSVLFLIFGVLPALGIFAVFIYSESEFKRAFMAPAELNAAAINDTIDRNLFERYGDVQAFGVNAAAHDPANWHNPNPDNPLIHAINSYMTGYGIYRMMLLVDTSGQVLAVNTVDGRGRTLDTRAIYDLRFDNATWFKKALAGQFLEGTNGLTGTVVEQPAANALVGQLYGDDGYSIPFAAPVKDASGRTLGVWVNFADFGLVEEIIAQFYQKLAAQGMADAELTVLDPKGNVIVDYDPKGQGWSEYQRDPEVVGKLNLAERGVEAAAAAVKGESGAIVATHARKQVDQVAGFHHSVGAYDYLGLGWSILVRLPVEEAFAAVDTVQSVMMIAIAVAVVAILILGVFIGTVASRPIIAMTSAMTHLAKGDTTVAVPSLGRKDEIGGMADAVQVFKENAIEKVKMEEAQKEAEKRTEQEKRQAMLDLADSLESSVKSIVEGVSAAATEMESTAQSMSATAEETNRQSTTVASAAEEASTNVQTVASAAEELSSSIEEVGRQVTQSSKVASAAVTEAEATNTSVKGLAVAAEKIGAVVSLIQDIAEQTNLLALNATIEAARAGEAGKGFAVVASEVKSLANQTAKATEEIGGQIAAIQGSTTEAVTAIGGISKIIGELDEIAASISAAVEEQGAATQEIARNVQQAAQGTGDVSSNIGGIAQAAGETGAAATQVLTAAQGLAKQSAELRSEIDKFLARVRAA
jgi:methyl-accepting chemotaxis protein